MRIRVRGIPRGWRRWSGDGIRFVYPRTWTATRYSGVLATAVLPMVFLGPPGAASLIAVPVSAQRRSLRLMNRPPGRRGDVRAMYQPLGNHDRFAAYAAGPATWGPEGRWSIAYGGGPGGVPAPWHAFTAVAASLQDTAIFAVARRPNPRAIVLCQ